MAPLTPSCRGAPEGASRSTNGPKSDLGERPELRQLGVALDLAVPLAAAQQHAGRPRPPALLLHDRLQLPLDVVFGDGALRQHLVDGDAVVEVAAADLAAAPGIVGQELADMAVGVALDRIVEGR